MRNTLRTATTITGLAIVVGSFIAPAGIAAAADAASPTLLNNVMADTGVVAGDDFVVGEDTFAEYPQVPLGWRKVTLEWDDGGTMSVDDWAVNNVAGTTPVRPPTPHPVTA